MKQLKMGFRWFGEKDDDISLAQIRQIPQTKQVVGALFDVPVLQYLLLVIDFYLLLMTVFLFIIRIKRFFVNCCW